jgi:hypothetical protein
MNGRCKCISALSLVEGQVKEKLDRGGLQARPLVHACARVSTSMLRLSTPSRQSRYCRY